MEEAATIPLFLDGPIAAPLLVLLVRPSALLLSSSICSSVLLSFLLFFSLFSSSHSPSSVLFSCVCSLLLLLFLFLCFCFLIHFSVFFSQIPTSSFLFSLPHFSSFTVPSSFLRHSSSLDFIDGFSSSLLLFFPSLFLYSSSSQNTLRYDGIHPRYP